MKKILSIIICFIIITNSFAQSDIYTKRATITDSLKLKSRFVNDITNDTALSTISAKKLATEYAIYWFVMHHLGGGGSGTSFDSASLSNRINRRWSLDGNSIVSTDFLGSINNSSLILKTNNIQRAVIAANGFVGIGTSIPNYVLHAYTTTRANTLAVDGNNAPAIAFLASGVWHGEIGISTAADDFFTNVPAGDINFRTDNNNIHIGKTDFVNPNPTIPEAVANVPNLNITSKDQIGIGTVAPNASATFDIVSTTKGLLIPRMTTTQRNAIPTPATSLQVFNTTTNQFEFYNGTAWVASGGSGGIDSVRKASNSDSIKQFTAGTETFAVRTQRVFNVKDYGAKGDSTTNDRDAIQLAINACFTAGGGTVYFPNGIYLVNGLVTSGNNNSILTIPSSYVDRTRTHITFLGETRPNFIPASLYVDTTYSRNGTIIRSTTTGSGINPAIFGGVGTGSLVTDPAYFNFNFITFENLTIINKANAGTTGPSLSGINGLRLASSFVNNCIVGIDTSIFRDTIPSLQVAGILTAQTGGETFSRITNTLVYGYRYGIFAGEHCYLDNAQVWNCYAAFVITPTSVVPVFATKIESNWNYIDILVPNTTTMGVGTGTTLFQIGNINGEHYTTNTRWFNNYKCIVDSGNRATGTLNYNFTNTGGSAGTYTKYNGNTIYGGSVGIIGASKVLGGSASTSSLTLQSTEASPNASGADIIFKTNSSGGEVVRILNNGYVGIGINPALAPLHIKNAFGASYGQLALQTTSGNGNAAIVYQSFYDAANTRIALFGLGHYIGGTDPNLYLVNEISAGGIKFRNASADILTIANDGKTYVGGSGTATSSLQSGGSFSLPIFSKALDYTATATDHSLLLTVTGKTITLPTSIGILGRIYTIKLTASGTGTVATTSSQTIDGATTYSLSAQYKYVTVQSDGANWMITGNN